MPEQACTSVPASCEKWDALTLGHSFVLKMSSFATIRSFTVSNYRHGGAVVTGLGLGTISVSGGNAALLARSGVGPVPTFVNP